MAVVSPIFRKLQLEKYGVEWVAAPLPLAHPLDDGRVAVLSRQMSATVATLGRDGAGWDASCATLRGPSRGLLQQHPASAACAATSLADGALRPGRPSFVRPPRETVRGCSGPRAAGRQRRAFVSAARRIASASFGLVLAVAGHAVDWPCARGGFSTDRRGAGRYARERAGARFAPDVTVRSLGRHPGIEGRTLRRDAATAPCHCLRTISRPCIPAPARALSLRGRRRSRSTTRSPVQIPWRASECADAATVHVGGTCEEMARSEADANAGRVSDAPFVLVAQQSHFDATRAPAGRHTGLGLLPRAERIARST